MRVVDAHRILGPIPMGAVPESAAELLEDLDMLDIHSAAVTLSWMLFGDPRSAALYESQRATELSSNRLIHVPVVIPAVADSGWPRTVEEISEAVMVRACPVRHRFDPLGPTAMGWWRVFAERETVLALDAEECGLTMIKQIADAVPRLNILMLNPGYREQRRLAELLPLVKSIHLETGTLVAAGAVEWFANTIGAHRLVFGTGAPLRDDAGPRFQLDHLDLPEEAVSLIAHGTWDRLTGGPR